MYLVRLLFLPLAFLSFPASASAAEPGNDTAPFIGDVYAHSPQFLNDGKKLDEFVQKHSVEFAYQGQTGDVTSVDVGVATTSVLYWDETHNTLQLFGEYIGGKDADGTNVVLSQKRAAQNFFRWHVEQSWYLFGLAAWERDQAAGIDNIYIGCTGPGYYLVEHPKGVVQIEVGGCRTHEDRTDGYEDLHAATGLVALKVFYSLGPKLFAGTEIEVFTNLDDTSDVLTHINAGITGRMSATTFLKVTFLARHDTAPVSDRQATNTQLNVSLGYTFP